MIYADTETTGLNHYIGDRAFMLCLLDIDGFGFKVFEGAVNPQNREVFWDKRTLEEIQKLLDAQKSICFYNANFDYGMMRAMGLDLSRLEIEDGYLAMRILNPTLETYRLKPLCKHWLGIEEDDEFELQEAVKKLRKKTKTLKKEGVKIGDSVASDYWMCREECKVYIERDVYRLASLWRQIIIPNMKNEPALQELYRKEKELFPIVQQMQERGVFIDYKKMEDMYKKYKSVARLCKAKFQTLLGITNVNMRSPKQISEMLYDRMGMISPDGTRSVSKRQISRMSASSPNAPALNFYVKYRAALKGEQTLKDFFRLIPDASHPVMHPHFAQAGTATGRFSCSEPNLQNVGVLQTVKWHDKPLIIRSFFIPLAFA